MCHQRGGRPETRSTRGPLSGDSSGTSGPDSLASDVNLRIPVRCGVSDGVGRDVGARWPGLGHRLRGDGVDVNRGLSVLVGLSSEVVGRVYLLTPRHSKDREGEVELDTD